MRVLFDNCTPEPLKRWLFGHDVSASRNLGWTELSNGELVAAAEKDGFEVIVTCGTNPPAFRFAKSPDTNEFINASVQFGK